MRDKRGILVQSLKQSVHFKTSHLGLTEIRTLKKITEIGRKKYQRGLHAKTVSPLLSSSHRKYPLKNIKYKGVEYLIAQFEFLKSVACKKNCFYMTVNSGRKSLNSVNICLKFYYKLFSNH